MPLEIHCYYGYFLRVRLLEREFDYIEYQNILRHLNTLADVVASSMINRHLQ